MKHVYLMVMAILILFVAACGSQPAQPIPQQPTQGSFHVGPEVLTATALFIQPVQPTPVQPAGGGSGQIANPASKNCIAKGGKLDIRTDSSGGQFGVCVFPTGKECEEWALMRGQCTADGGAVGKSSASPTYNNPAYGFGFNYDPSWTLQEAPPAANKPLMLILTRGHNILTIQVKHASDSVAFEAAAPQGGEITLQGLVSVLGQETTWQLVKLQGVIKSAGVNVNTPDLQFRFQLDNQADPEIPADVLAEAEQIITSLQITK